MNNLDQWYISQPEPNAACFLALRQIIIDFDERITETMKYGMPCFCLDGKAFCYLWKDKKTQEPYILLVEGHRIDHPLLQSGDRKRMKILPIDPNSDLPISVIDEVLQLAKSFYS